MVGIQDYGPVSTPPGAIELRVHGVSGTPPEALIKATPILVAGTPTAGFHRHEAAPGIMTRDSPGVREGYAWGGLTSGTRITSALRLLLLPFSLVNVAGWMLPGVRHADGAPTRPAHPETVARRAAAHALVSRLLAVLLTAYITLGATWVATVAVERLTGRYDLPLVDTPDAQARVTMLAVLALVLVWVAISHRRAAPTSEDAPGAMARAPVAAPAQERLDVSRLWDGSDVARRLSGIHAAVALSCAALLTDAALGSATTLAGAGRAAAWAALVLAAAGLLAFLRLDGWGRRLAALVRALAVPLALLAVVLTVSQRGSLLSQPELLRRVGHSLTLGMASLAVGVFVLVVLQVAVGPRGGPLAGRLYASSFTVIGFGTAITGVSGLAVIITWLVSGHDPAAFVAGLAQTIAIVGIVSVCALLVVVLLRLNATSQPASVPWFARLRDTTAHARGAIVAAACVFAVGANAVAAMYLIRGDAVAPAGLHDGEGGWASWGWLALAAVAAAAVAARLSSWAARVAATVVGAAVITAAALYGAAAVGAWIAHDSFGDRVSGILASSDQWFVVTAVIAALVAPMAGVIGYMWRGSKDQSTRRLVGVLWDLVNFWPRQFHPWAPPPYTDTTIPGLADRVRHLAQASGAHTVIVSAHSQGAIIAVPALSRLKASGEPVTGAKVALLTYGQLLDAHYRWLFPWVFNPELFAEVDAFLEHRWINLFRITDPLGQPVGALPDDRNERIANGLVLDVGSTAKPKTLNHGDYWYSQAVYQRVLDELADLET